MTELVLTLANNAHDADQNAAGTVTLDRTGFTVDVVGEYAAWLFTGATIPNAATINSATASIYAFGSNSDDPSGSLYCADEDDAAAPAATINNLSGRTPTTATVAWDDTNVTGGADDFATTPDISTVIQEIVNRPGWVSGNDLLLIFACDGGSSIRFGYRDGNASWAATLTIDYTAGGIAPLAAAYYQQLRA